MTLHRSPRGKITRRLGVNVFGNAKYDRLLDRKPQGPGKAPKARSGKKSEYAVQLVEKQKLRLGYGFGERQFRNMVLAALAAPGVTGDNLLARLETSLASVVWRLGWAASRAQARQIAVHGHVFVNGRRADRPSMALSAGDRVELRVDGGMLAVARENLERRGPTPPWLSRDDGGLSGKILSTPAAVDAAFPGKVQLVVEYYAR